ncbi:hypothetical protein EI42_01974 [Thermosporothrix hazakensis]|jgi:hypothetical protein|uniref:Uncharacterized protein n=2 Tax=Thermosporothrix TaxID=768650 RepID=A0A326UCE9_THEHA|nr:hypothetical protein [Thermosporothrix hazakensis]PZW31949.1 hypothetical protein EI42_01974 [Thermosporothrix hazakensis]BBH91580.1 hypothetical protein KTC_63310 [Thermosporothrix sp. COM3]GCE49726.1 hypothetical protein KTH_45950 [Thermosporothrix hazakensis]
MKVIFRSKDFASIEGAGFGFVNRRPMHDPWSYQGRVKHRDWQGTYECHWERPEERPKYATSPREIIWVVEGDARLFGLAAALKAKGLPVDVAQD